MKLWPASLNPDDFHKINKPEGCRNHYLWYMRPMQAAFVVMILVICIPAFAATPAGNGPDTLVLERDLMDPHTGIFGDYLVFRPPGSNSLQLHPLSAEGSPGPTRLSEWRDLGFQAAELSFSADNSLLLYSDRDKIYRFHPDSGFQDGPSTCWFSGDPARDLHPALSSDGSMMVFASDRAPSEGGLDLFVTPMHAHADQEVRNLGAHINTPGHEQYPFLDSRNNLWFCSSGHGGYGAHDLYICLWDGKTWGRAMNLGSQINTTGDELAPHAHEGHDRLYFSRAAGNGKLPLILHSAFSAVTLDARSMKIQEETAAEAEEKPELLYRVQVLARTRPGSTANLEVDGESHPTWEYFYKGAYRITLGEFRELEEADAFRLRCKDSGFEQAFVAAFVDGKRELKPSKYK